MTSSVYYASAREKKRCTILSSVGAILVIMGVKEVRETKFRAWDKKSSRWIKLWKLCFAVTGELMAVEDIDGEVYGLHQIELVEYTGLKDKNGKEIYEGDILRDDAGSLIAIKWMQDTGFAEAAPYSSGGWGADYITYYGSRGECYLNDANDVNEHEVIGNVWENPELLQQGAKESEEI